MKMTTSPDPFEVQLSQQNHSHVAVRLRKKPAYIKTNNVLSTFDHTKEDMQLPSVRNNKFGNSSTLDTKGRQNIKQFKLRNNSMTARSNNDDKSINRSIDSGRFTNHPAYKFVGSDSTKINTHRSKGSRGGGYQKSIHSISHHIHNRSSSKKKVRKQRFITIQNFNYFNSQKKTKFPCKLVTSPYLDEFQAKTIAEQQRAAKFLEKERKLAIKERL